MRVLGRRRGVGIARTAGDWLTTGCLAHLGVSVAALFVAVVARSDNLLALGILGLFAFWGAVITRARVASRIDRFRGEPASWFEPGDAGARGAWLVRRASGDTY